MTTGLPTGWTWYFGDGETSTLKNPVHTYSTAGKYTVYLTAINERGSNTTSRLEYISVNSSLPSPIASFTKTQVNGVAPMEVSFKDTSTGIPTSWIWFFGDGETSTDQNPSHIYQTDGTYTVYLVVTNSGGSNTTGQNGVIKVQSSGLTPVVNFTGSPLSGTVPLAVKFMDESSNSPTNWTWYLEMADLHRNKIQTICMDHQENTRYILRAQTLREVQQEQERIT